jgi:hypothetical protein
MMQRTLKQNLASRLIVLLVSSAITLPALAQLDDAPMPQVTTPNASGPSLEETLQWLKEKYDHDHKSAAWNFINTYESSASSTGLRVNEIEFNGCNVLAVEKSYEIRPPIPSLDAEQIVRNYMPEKIIMKKVSLSDLDVKVTTWGGNFFFDTIGEAEKVIHAGMIIRLKPAGKGWSKMELPGRPVYVGKKVERYDDGKEYITEDFQVSNPVTAQGYELMKQQLKSGELVDIACSHYQCEEDLNNSHANKTIWSLQFSDQAIAIRAAEAMKHAIGLCQDMEQQKRQKEAAEPKKKEIF